jgi:hypothetical protein
MSRQRIRSNYTPTKLCAGVILALIISQSSEAISSAAAEPNPFQGQHINFISGVRIEALELRDVRRGSDGVEFGTLPPDALVQVYGVELHATFLVDLRCSVISLLEALDPFYPTSITIAPGGSGCSLKRKLFPMVSQTVVTVSGQIEKLKNRRGKDASGGFFHFREGDTIYVRSELSWFRSPGTMSFAPGATASGIMLTLEGIRARLRGHVARSPSRALVPYHHPRVTEDERAGGRHARQQPPPPPMGPGFVPDTGYGPQFPGNPPQPPAPVMYPYPPGPGYGPQFPGYPPQVAGQRQPPAPGQDPYTMGQGFGYGPGYGPQFPGYPQQAAAKARTLLHPGFRNPGSKVSASENARGTSTSCID